MKKQIVYLSTFIALIVCGVLSVTQSSCSKQKDACSGVVCQHSGTCANGTCTCPVGFSGANCETPYSATYAGTYTGTDDQLHSDTIIIASDSTAYGVSVNAKTKGVSFKGTVLNDTITIPSQSFSSGLFTGTISGSGVFNLPNARITYTTVSGSSTTVIFTGHK